MTRLIVVRVGNAWDVREADPKVAGGYGALVAGPFPTKREATRMVAEKQGKNKDTRFHYWERYGIDNNAFVLKYGDDVVAYVHRTPFGWIAACSGKVDGMYREQHDAQMAMQKEFDVK